VRQTAEPINDPALPHYEYLSRLSGQMLAHAQAQDWNVVVTLCLRYQQAVDDLREMMGSELPVNVAARHALLSKILSDDVSLRDLISPELTRLGKLLGMLKRKRTLHQTYGTHQDCS